jgi:DNA repair exonuclease SbcCD ATPase subunit
MEKRGIRTERGEHNRQIEVTNRQLRQLRAQINELKNWLRAEMKEPEPPTLAEVVQGILDRRKGEGRRQTIDNLKAAAKTLNFLTENGIKNMSGLQEKVKSMYDRLDDVRAKLKPVERRLDTLDEHLKQAAVLAKHKPIYTQYQELQRPRKRNKFREEHWAEIALYESAKRYFDERMNGRATLPVKAWKDEREKLIDERNTLYQDYDLLKDETREVDLIKYSVEYLIREDVRRTRLPWDRGMER